MSAFTTCLGKAVPSCGEETRNTSATQSRTVNTWASGYPGWPEDCSNYKCRIHFGVCFHLNHWQLLPRTTRSAEAEELSTMVCAVQVYLPACFSWALRMSSSPLASSYGQNQRLVSQCVSMNHTAFRIWRYIAFSYEEASVTDLTSTCSTSAPASAFQLETKETELQAFWTLVSLAFCQLATLKRSQWWT